MRDGSFKKQIQGEKTRYKAIGMAILAAALYGLSSPASKLLLNKLSPTFLAALLYIGAGVGMFIIRLATNMINKGSFEAKLTQKEIPYIVGMIVLDVVAPIMLMIGLSWTTSSNASLLNNFEIVATSLIALAIFKETIGKKMWIAIVIITMASILLSVNDFTVFEFSWGSLFVLLACVAWGFENNCTRMLSLKDPLQIVVIKGLGSGVGSLIICFVLQEIKFNVLYIMCALFLGFVAYGLSITFYIRAQRHLGAARTSAFYAMAPFIGVIISWIFLREAVSNTFMFAFGLMLIGAYFVTSENHKHLHKHTQESHEHKHNHDDDHHNHHHDFKVLGEHSHKHVHEAINHKHSHLSDLHHRHTH